MPQARKRLIDIKTTPYYHCVARCVRRAFLCGECHITGQNYEHRKNWLSGRLALLSQVFAIDIAAYAVMSNHYHLVLRVNVDQTEQWSNREIIQRWGQLFSIPPVVKAAQCVDATSVVYHQAQQILNTWKSRLSDISWFRRYP